MRSLVRAQSVCGKVLDAAGSFSYNDGKQSERVCGCKSMPGAGKAIHVNRQMSGEHGAP